MYYVKTGYGCGLKVSLVQPGGAAVDLRRVRYVGAILHRPGGQTMTVSDINADELTNNVFVRLLATRELTVEGDYSIVFNVKLADNTMYSTALTAIVNVDDNNDPGFNEATLSLALTVIDCPSDATITGSSPKIGPNDTWLVYDDTLGAYVDTGVKVGYTDIISQLESYLGVLAHSDASIEKRVETLEALVIGVITGKVVVESLNVRNLGVWGSNNLVVVGSGAPTKKPDRAGQIYIDTANNTAYKSIGNSAVSDWKTI